MAKVQKTASTRSRARRRHPDLVHIEVQVRNEDAALVHRIARMLADPTGEARARAILQRSLVGIEPSATGLKALLAAAPLDGIDLGRVRGRR